MENSLHFTSVSMDVSMNSEDVARGMRPFQSEVRITIAIGAVKEMTIQLIWRHDEYDGPPKSPLQRGLPKFLITPRTSVTSISTDTSCL